ncbi:pantetheine-phosphate adenylyltransferase [Candidatus Nitrosopelagicus sp.]|nr:pantetheine-phosphate adenylyltransferase [Candidatus Nitrosopelagicus sp.]
MKYEIIALGGTFDIIHAGHIALLKRGFAISKKVIIGLTSDKFALKNGKELVNKYEKRHSSLKLLIEEKFLGSKYEIAKLENDFGPAVVEGNVEALIVSTETQDKGEILNKLRAEKNLQPVKIISVSMVLAEDGNRISTTRIRDMEIDFNGKLR